MNEWALHGRSGRPQRIAIVDDHQIVRAGFRELLADELGLEIVLEAASGEAALEALREQPVDVLLLDLSLPGQSGVDVLRAVRQRYEGTRVLMLSGFPEERYALAMIRNGADGYLCKDCERDELIRAIRTVAEGRRYVSARTAELLAEELAGLDHGGLGVFGVLREDRGPGRPVLCHGLRLA